jgi:(p)ppGpp synthase/HD superfamily hydrolase
MLERVRQLILKYNTKKKFLRRVAFRYGMDTKGYLLIKKAYELARVEFRGLKRHSGEPYFYHKLAVAVILMEYLEVDDPNLVAAALLHDLIEDIEDWTEQKLQREFNRDVAKLVASVTKPDKSEFGDNLHQYELVTFTKVIGGGQRAVVLKLADRLHNMLTLWGSPKKKLEKTLETLQYVLPLAVEEGILWQELTVACSDRIILHKVIL